MTYKRKVRQWGKRKLKMPKPKAKYRGKSEGKFELRLLTEVDQRYAVVRAMHQRLEKLKDDAGINSIQGEMLSARAIFILSFLESLEANALDGQQIDYREYLQATRTLTDILSKLGLDREKRSAQTLSQYIVDAQKATTKNGSK